MSIRVIHVGVGVRGRHWLDVIASHADFVSVACVDQDEKALEAAQSCPGQEHGVFSTDLNQTLREVKADAAVIVTPSFLHFEHTRLALESGLAVLVEKPLAFTLPEAAASIELARKLGKALMVAENFRFFQAERTVRQLIDDGRLGRIGSIICIDRRDQPSHSQGAWVKSLPDPFLNEIAVHHFDSFRYLFNRQPRAILSRSYDPPGSDYDNGAAMEALIELEGGLRIQYSGTLVASRYEYELRVEGEKGEVRTDRKSVSWRPAGSKSFEKVELVPVPKGDELPYPRAGTVSILNQFRDAVLQGAEPETSGRDNIWTLAMVQAAKQSQEHHREVAISDVFTEELRRQAGIEETQRNATAVGLGQRKTRGGKRVFFIGLDAGDAELIEQWEKEGFLPHIRGLRARGVSGRLGTTAEIVHVSAWPSIFTGVTPDKHGLYHAYVMNPGEQSPVRPRPDLSPFPFFWKLLNDAGLRSVVMDAFMTCPLQNFNGSQIVEWGTWSWFCEPSISPPSLKAEIERRFGPYPAPEHSQVAGLPDSRWFRDVLVSAVDHKTEVIKWLMQKEDWDLFLTVFGETHPAGHYLWHLHDPSYPSHPAAADPDLRHALRDVYVAIDDGIGEILRQVDDNTTVFLVSGDGMGPNYSASHLLEELLETMGLLAVAGKDGTEAGDKPKLSRDQLLSRLRGMVPQSLRTAVSQRFFSHSMKEKLALKWLTAGIAWDRTRAFLISNANEGFVRINLQGREPQGIVQPGDEYATVLEEICQVIKTMTSPAGIPVAQSVHKTDKIFEGPRRNQMPDLIVNWNPEARVTDQLLTEKFGPIRSREPGYGIVPFYVGNHRPNAFAIVAGPGVSEGESLRGGHTLDLTPTLLSLFEVRPPEYMDGKVLSELCGQTEVLTR
jgi:predicted dehydrogenase/predicted AlkP superfamily phosphohydrolase/phosphomutase